MVRIPNIKIPSVRVGSIVPTSNIGTGGATPAPPTPITYLTQWKIVGNSEVHNLPYPDGVVLPTGYKRCEYLTFDGNSYIDTNTTIDADTIVEITASTATSIRWLLGSRVSDVAGRTNVCFGMYGHGGVSDKLLVGHGGGNNQILTGSNLLDNTKHSIIIENGKLTFDSVEYSLDIRNEYNSSTILIGALKLQDGTPHSSMWRGNICDTIIYNTQAELWHGIPCLDANDVPCFYDIVSQTAFYNQGSGSFTYKLYPQSTEIWSCGEYNATDGKYHILVQPQGGSIADIALTKPLRKVNDVADTIEFPSETESKALVTRNLKPVSLEGKSWDTSNAPRYVLPIIGRELDFPESVREQGCIMCSTYSETTFANTYNTDKSIGIAWNGTYNLISLKDTDVVTPATDITGEVILKLTTPTTELVDAPQIEEANSYICVISQGAKAVSWSGFETDSE